MFQFWGILVIFTVCPLLGGLPLITWISQFTNKRQLTHLYTDNISTSAAFYQGGTIVGILAVFSEAFKGIAAVLLARAFFGYGSAWELIALIAVVIGRYSTGKGTGTTSVAWGFSVHDPLASVFVFLLTGASFTILRSRQLAKFGVLILFPLIVALLHIEDPSKFLAALSLAALLGWIYKNMPKDLSPSVEEIQASPVPLQFLRSNQDILSLDEDMDAALIGHKAARLSEVKRWGYSVPKGWVLAPYQDPAPLIEFLQPSKLSPLVVRSSAIGEDTEHASAAGQYETILHVTTKHGLQQAIARVQASYNNPTAVQYRRDRNLNEQRMGVLIQQQVQSVFFGVAFTRDPMTKQGDTIIIEALPGKATQVVSGRVTPEQYRAFVVETEDFQGVQLEGEGRVPPALIKQVAYLARHLEERYHGIPQDIEWSYDGQTLWVLQVRPISTLLPIWTRKIAAETFSQLIHPLTWSINRPSINGVWGGIFALTLGERAVGLDFNQIATLHYSRVYFNATLLWEIFCRLGLPAESLDFLTKGGKLAKPPLKTVLQNLPGMLRLVGREFCLATDFNWDYHRRFVPALSQFTQELVDDLEPTSLLARIDFIRKLLLKATYYSILASLSVKLRQKTFHVALWEVDRHLTPEVAVVRSLQDLAVTARAFIPDLATADQVFEKLAQTPQGQEILTKLDKLLHRYAYLSEGGTDLAVPTWKEEPEAIKQSFVQFIQGEPSTDKKIKGRWNVKFVQRRVNLQGRVTEVYSKFQAELRWCFVALEQVWLKSGLLEHPGDIFFLDLDEVRRLIDGFEPEFVEHLQDLVQLRRSQKAKDTQQNPVPSIVYGNNSLTVPLRTGNLYPDQMLQGIPASPGQVEGRVKVWRNLQALPEIDRETILVVPYTDISLVSFLMRAGGFISEVGGRLSHGAILAREYGIPAITDVRNATWILQDGQKVRIDGYKGIVEISNDLRPG
ncbi:MAG: glycerol-3-phosphate acyltransferase [Rhizonema sp. PD37]|nr:glycerol-3-phosphate acyltransferase [Rhizonema sp. PD37]